MFFECSEGGAGVLKRLIDDPKALSKVAATALQICHFNPENGTDFRKAPGSKEECEAACYDCLMSYRNQMDHQNLDRQKIKEYLISLKKSEVEASPTSVSRSTHLERLLRLCQSDLERKWLKFINDRNLRLPTRAQGFIEICRTRPDFLYDNHSVVVYVDGSPHNYKDRQRRDAEQTNCMEDGGYTVIRFGIEDDWGSIVGKYPNIF